MNNFKKLLLKSSILVSVIAPMTVSCIGLDEVWDKIDSIEAQLDSIQNDLNSQMEALSALMTDGSTISTCVQEEDGSYLVTLSNGTSFTVLPEGADASALVSYVDVDGVKCWATYGPDGVLTPLKDASGNAIPAEAEISVEVKDGKYVLIVNGEKYVTGYDAEDVVSVFSSCVAHKDASGQVYAMTFTFGDDIKVTVAVDGYRGVIFKLSNVGSAVAVTEYFIDNKATQTFLMEAEGVIDYIMQIPDGWRVEEYVDELSGEKYVDITAPSAETIAAGAAVAEGDLKVVSVVDGGKAAVTKLSLSTEPFKVYNVSSVKAVVEPYNGVQKYVYGMMDLNAFDKAQLMTSINTILLSSSDLPKGYNIAEGAIDKTFAEIYGDELTEEGEYLFWIVPALYSEGTDGDGGYYAVERMLRTKIIAPIRATIEVSGITVIDANVKVTVKGTLSMYAGTSEKTENILEDIAYRINNGIAEPLTESLTYNGSVTAFPNEESSVEIEPAKTYITWVVPVDDEKETYLASDVIYKEFTTPALQSGGALTVTPGEITVDCSSISIPFSSTGAELIYYTFLSNTEGSRLSTAENDAKANKILSSADLVVERGTSAVAELDYIKPETTMWLFAMAVGADGKYGEVLSQSATTDEVVFNSLTVTVDDPTVSSNEAVFKVSVADGTATDYIYWCGKATDPFWLYEEYCNGMRSEAEIYMAANPDAEAITSVMRKNGSVGADGTLVISDLELSTTYVFLILAKDADGKYSKCAYKKFTTLAADLGNVVATGSEKWNTTKQWIEDNIVWLEELFEPTTVYATYAVDIKIPTDLTAYIYGFATQSTKTYDIMIEIEEECISSTSVPRVVYDENGEQPTLPDWYDDNGRFIAGTLVNVYNMYPHGATDRAAVTYFSSNGHSALHCNAWANGACQNYQTQVNRINELMSFEYWKEYIVDFGNYAYMGDPNHKYSRTLTDPEKINTIAKQYQDLYIKYYTGIEPILYINNGEALRIINRSAVGVDENGNVVDQVTIVLVDAEGNYYEPMYFPVPNYYN